VFLVATTLRAAFDIRKSENQQSAMRLATPSFTAVHMMLSFAFMMMLET
jgi:hypothetical protein